MTSALIRYRLDGKSYVELTELIGVNLHGIIAKCNELGFLPLVKRGRPSMPNKDYKHICHLLEIGLSGKVISERTGYNKSTISRIKNEQI